MDFPESRVYQEKQPMRILVAENNHVNQRVVLSMLRKLGYHPDLATNGLEVLKEMEQKSYDIIFMDIWMPKMDGLEAAHHIREHANPRPYIIALTASVMKQDRINCFKAGMQDFLAKPFTIEDLELKIAQYWLSRVTGTNL